ncbi:MAG: GNAT family N-acetyltransferase [Anaerolineae bacterium]|nr:GNAT family N-acetyltransferase [Anaerolineae bacterium]
MSELFDFSAFPCLESERLLLREVDPARDAQALFDLFSDPITVQLTDVGPFTDPQEAQEILDWVADIYAQRRGIRWAAARKDDPAGTLIGLCGYNYWLRWNDCGEVGYHLARPYWNQGLMTEAMREVVRFGFTHMALHRIEADVTVGNVGSARVLEKLGFTREGLLRGRGHWRDAYHDLWFYGLLRDDWAAGDTGAAAPSAA